MEHFQHTKKQHELVPWTAAYPRPGHNDHQHGTPVAALRSRILLCWVISKQTLALMSFYLLIAQSVSLKEKDLQTRALDSCKILTLRERLSQKCPEKLQDFLRPQGEGKHSLAACGISA